MVVASAKLGAQPVADGGHPSGDERFALVDKHLRKVQYSQDQLIETLHAAQDVFGYLTNDVMLYVARALRLPPSMVYGVATFYHLFTFESPGDHTCTVCTGTACFVKGADAIVRAVSEEFDVAPGMTSDDGVVSLSAARCLGSCGLAPVVVLDGGIAGQLDPAEVVERVRAAIAAGEGA